MNDKDYKLSSYLTFRYFIGTRVNFQVPKIKVYSSQDVITELNKIILKLPSKTGIFLSSGIDSAILAALMPKGTKAYTIVFDVQDSISEAEQASKYASLMGLDHKIVNVTKENYFKVIDQLILQKQSPLHPVEPALYIAATQAKSDGIASIVTGNGADSNFGGMDKLLSKDWNFEEFINRYSYIDPKIILKRPLSMVMVYEKYKNKETVDVQRFLSQIHGEGIINSFYDSIVTAGCTLEMPYEHLDYDLPLDINRIRNGEPKYILREIYKEYYPSIDIPEKIPFARPMDSYMDFYLDTHRNEFIDFDMNLLTGEQKWLVFCLERYLDLLEENS